MIEVTSFDCICYLHALKQLAHLEPKIHLKYNKNLLMFIKLNPG